MKKNEMIVALLLLIFSFSQAQIFHDHEYFYNGSQLRLTVTNTGLFYSRYGSANMKYPVSLDRSILYKGAIWIGALNSTGDTLVSSGDGNELTSCPEFHDLVGMPVEIDSSESTQSNTKIEYQYSDSYPVIGHTPIGIKIRQKTLAWNNIPSIIQIYEITSDSISNVEFTNLYFGIYMDFDISPDGNEDLAGHIPIGSYNDPGVISFITSFERMLPCAGITILNHFSTCHRIWKRGNDPSNDQEKYRLLSSRIFDENTETVGDYRILQSVGPFNFAQKETLNVAVAIAAVSNPNALGGIINRSMNHWADKIQRGIGKKVPEKKKFF